MSISDQALPVKIMHEKFERLFKNFNYEFYHELESERELNEHGSVKGSCLITEILKLSAQFVEKSVLRLMDIEETTPCAVEGWNLSLELFSKTVTRKKLQHVLDKKAKKIQRAYRHEGIKISVSQVSWIIYTMAMLREKLYREFEYLIHEYTVDYSMDEPMVIVLYTQPKKNLEQLRLRQKPFFMLEES